MSRQVVITGLGPLSAAGVGIDATWAALLAGTSGLGPVKAFDASGFACSIAGEVKDFAARNVVPKSYRKAVKVMARDIELAVGAADAAARDAGLKTPGTAEGEPPSYAADRIGAHIGAGLIACEINELTPALAASTNGEGKFDYHKFGSTGITQVTPLWLLKYLPNMLACHVTIIHDCQGPSNTITCNEASSHLSIGESLRVIQRGDADLCFCGGMESRINPLGMLRQVFSGRMNTQDNANPASAVRPFCETAAGMVMGEGGGIVILESREAAEKRGAKPYALLKGFGASQTVNREARNLKPDPQGRGIASAIRAAMREAGVGPGEIDLIVPFGIADADYDRAEVAALTSVFGDALKNIPIASTKPITGNCGAGAGGLDVCVAAKAVREQTVPTRINCSRPIAGMNAGAAPSHPAPIRNVLSYCTSLGGQNAAMVMGRI